MPLIKGKSPKVFAKNVETEAMSGKPMPQALAIAYNMKRHALKKKMAKGGMVTANEESMKKNAIDEAKDPMEMAMMKKKKMAQGGEISADDESMEKDSIDDAYSKREMAMLKGHPVKHKSEQLASQMGRVTEDDEDEQEMDMLHPKYAKGGVVHGIMMKKKMMAKGGEVDLQDNGDEDLNLEDDLSFEAARKPTYYDLDQVSDDPEDSNMHGDDIDSDDHSMISMIRKKMKSRR